MNMSMNINMNTKTKEFLQELFNTYKTDIIEFQGKCCICEVDVNLEIEMDHEGKTTISGGALYTTDTGKKVLKCASCFEEQPILYVPCGAECEVYSRVVGYLRPVKQWNPGKKEEFKMRTMFDSDTALKNLGVEEKKWISQ